MGKSTLPPQKTPRAARQFDAAFCRFKVLTLLGILAALALGAASFRAFRYANVSQPAPAAATPSAQEPVVPAFQIEHRRAVLQAAFLLYKKEVENALATAATTTYAALPPSLRDFIQQHAPQTAAAAAIANACASTKAPSSADSATLENEFRDSWTQLHAPVVPLARFARHTYNEGSVFEAEIRVANRADADLVDATVHTALVGHAFNETRTETLTLKRGQSTFAYDFNGPDGDGALAAYEGVPDAMTLTVTVRDKAGNAVGRNTWQIWCYPYYPDGDIDEALRGILVTQDRAAALAAFDAGKKVLLFDPPPPAAAAAPAFALQIDATHPLFRNFPTDTCTNWQWWNLLQPPRSAAPATQREGTCGPPPANAPAVTSRTIVRGFRNPRETSPTFLVSEGRAAPPQTGHLLVCALDERTLRATPEGRHLLVCIAEYLRSALP